MKILTIAIVTMLAYFLGSNPSRETLRYLLRGVALMVLLLFTYFIILQYHDAFLLFIEQFIDWLQRLPRR